MRDRVDVSQIKLTPFEDIFGSSTTVQTEPLSKLKAYELSLSDLKPFNGHTFKVIDDERMEKLCESINERGVLSPAIVRAVENGKYEIISGHRRKYACEKLGFKTMPAYVLSMTDDEAKICMVDCNMTQREVILPSEKAMSYRMKFEAVKHQGKRTGGLTASIIAEAYGESMSTVKRFIKLSYLSDDFLELLDDGLLGTDPGYEIAFLSESEQEIVYSIVKKMNIKLTKAQAVKLHEMSDQKNISFLSVEALLINKKIHQPKIVLKSDYLSKYFGVNYSEDEIREILNSLLEKWREEERHSGKA